MEVKENEWFHPGGPNNMSPRGRKWKEIYYQGNYTGKFPRTEELHIVD